MLIAADRFTKIVKDPWPVIAFVPEFETGSVVAVGVEASAGATRAKISGTRMIRRLDQSMPEVRFLIGPVGGNAAAEVKLVDTFPEPRGTAFMIDDGVPVSTHCLHVSQVRYFQECETL